MLQPVTSQVMEVGASGSAATRDGDICIGIRSLDHNTGSSLYQGLGQALEIEMVQLDREREALFCMTWSQRVT